MARQKLAKRNINLNVRITDEVRKRLDEMAANRGISANKIATYLIVHGINDMYDHFARG